MQTDFELLLKNDPNNADAKIELARVVQEKKLAAEKQKSFLKGMFSKGGLYEDKKPKEKKEKPKSKQETDSENEQMPELEKDEQDQKKKPETHGHQHHGPDCC